MSDPTPVGGFRSDPDAFARLESLFDGIVALEGEARARALADAGREHPDLRRELDALLAAHERLEPDDAADEIALPEIRVGSRVGAYSLVERLGEGGMGEVFRAERADSVFAGAVAVKLTRAGFRSTELVRRFQIERQILASLNHSNIVRLLDGGATASGQAYLIMEHVAGVPITEYCRVHRLGLRDRLAIFLDVCQAVQYAHQHGVVHRDLKPGNVLVGADGVAKIVDFGIAMLLDEAPHAAATTLGGLPGPLTPNYASPEQLRGLRVTTAADVYALGVLLYEIVSGARPYETQGETLDRILEIVLHRDPPPPSTVNARASDDRPYPGAALRGDIDAIVGMSMAKDPASRYASAGELASDVTRFLQGDAILARAPSAGYVLRRLASRHKAIVGVSAVALVATVAALGAALWQRQVALREQARAEHRLREVRQLANALIFKIHDAVLPLPGSTSVRRTIVAEAIGYLERLEADSGADVTLRLELAAAYRRLGNILGHPGSPNLGDRQGALKLFERSDALVAPLAAATRDVATVTALVDGQTARAVILNQQGDTTGAIALAREAHVHASRLESVRGGDPDASALAARATFGLAVLVPPAEARPLWDQTLARYERLLAATPNSPQMRRNVALVCKYLGSLLETAGEHEQARPHYARAVELDEQRLQAAPDDPNIQLDAAISFSSAASVAQRIGATDEAARLFERSLAMRRALVEADPQNMQARHRLGYLLARVAAFTLDRDPPTARARAREAVVILQRVHESTSDRQSRYDLGWAWLQAALAARHAGDRADACAALREAHAQWTDPPDVLEGAGQAGYVAETAAGLAWCSGGRDESKH